MLTLRGWRNNAPLSPEQIHFQVHGAEQSALLVLIHGRDSAGATFAPVLPVLAQKYRVLVYDQRGHGQTVDRGWNFSSTLLAKDLQGLLDYLGWDRVHLLGHSLGARTALRFADRQPWRVRSLIIEDMELRARFQGSLRRALKSAKRLKSKMPRCFPSRAAAVAALAPLFGDQAESITYRRGRKNADGSLSLLFRPHVSLAYGAQASAEDFSRELHRFSLPLLILRADPSLSAILSEMGVAHIRRHRPEAKIIQIAGAAHNVHGSKSELFLDHVLRFLAEEGR